MANSVITTIDNPWNPFTHFLQWYKWDEHHHYNTVRWLDLYTFTSNDLSDEQVDADVTDAQNKLLARNPFGLHVKVYDYEADTLIPILNKFYKEHQDELAVD